MVEEQTLARANELRRRAVGENSAGRPSQAVRSLHAALKLLPPLTKPASHAVDLVRVSCLLTLAVAEYARAGWAGAEPLLRQADVLAADDPELRARWRAQHGLILGRSGSLAEAVAELSVVRTEPGWFTDLERCSIMLNQGAAFLELGMPAEAIESYDAVIEIAAGGGYVRQLFMARHNRGFAHYLADDLPGALTEIAAAAAMDADVHRGTSLRDLGRVLHESGLLDEAREALDQAEATCTRREDRLLRADINLERARVLRLTGDLAQAAMAGRAARSAYRDMGSELLATRAHLTVLDCDLSLGRRLPLVREEALASAVAAEATGDVDLWARSLCVSSEAAVRLGQIDNARSALAAFPTQPLGLVLRLRRAYSEVLTDLAQGSNRSARTRLRNAAREVGTSQAAAAGLESRAARAVLGVRLASLDLGLALRQGPGAVFETLERWSTAGRALPVVRPSDDPRIAELTQDLRVLSRKLRDQPDDPLVPAWRADVEQRRRRLALVANSQRQADVLQPGGLSLAFALEHLQHADRDVLWLFVHDRALWGAGVSGGRRRVARLLDLESCFEQSRRIRADLRASVVTTSSLTPAVALSLRSDLEAFDDAVVRPWRFRSAGLVVIGCHAVGSVPWAMLPSLRGKPVTVGRSLKEWSARWGQGEPVVAVLAGPDLSHAAAESAAVSQAWAGSEVSAHGAATSSDLVLALATAEVVHVVAHGQHRPSSPLFSSLRLCDGDVYAHELPTGRVSAGHVILSACDAGSAEMRPGDEPLGMASTLVALGVRCVVAAVAPVADEVAETVMTRYHAQLAQGRPSDEALAVATEDGLGGAFVALGSTWRRR